METAIEQANMFETEPVGDLVRRVFVDLGGNVPARIVTQTILDRGLLPDQTRERLLFRGLNELVRRELARTTIEGLPFAQPTGTHKEAPWKQLDLFTRKEGHALVQRRRRQVYEDHSELMRLYNWCLDKYGDAPWIPELPTFTEDDNEISDDPDDLGDED